MNDHTASRKRVLQELGGDGHTVTQLLDYGANPFDLGMCCHDSFPLPDEPHLTDWREYAAACPDAAFGFLQDRLPQLCFPIQEGVSQSPAYADACRKGKPFSEQAAGGKLTLLRPEEFRLTIHEHAAGALPVLTTSHRPDFESLDRALAFRSEPVVISPSVNAHLIAGFVNWDRVERYRRLWLARNILNPAGWPAEMKRISTDEKWRFQDRFMLTCSSPYSSVGADLPGLDMDDATWLEKSTVLRIEHEFTHYATIRLFDCMRLNMLDETICDWAGMTAAMGSFSASWFLRFLGLEDWPDVRPDGRIHTYRQNLDDDAFTLLCALTVQTARGLQSLNETYYQPDARPRFLLALTQLTMELIASEDRGQFFLEAADAVRPLIG